MSSRLLKVEGAGNDFLLGTGSWARRLAEDPALVRRLCRRHRGIGADGVLALLPEESATVRLVYRNADGSEASFCANGTRCAARGAVELLGMPAAGLTVLTGWGPVAASVHGELVTLELPPPAASPRTVRLTAADRTWAGWRLTVGVPHLVLPTTELADLDLTVLGPPLRAHPRLGPEGANVNFIEHHAPGEAAVRTFERGVEAETLSCGSGVVAAALCSMAERDVSVLRCATRSGDELVVEAVGAPPLCPTRLTGPARFIAAVDPLP
ncbi:MAG TPA: diaminopimelate epimerase [Acidobacteria bacterium]|nr:diaminopimelate epimerase [Acidobacteriota bacterium]